MMNANSLNLDISSVIVTFVILLVVYISYKFLQQRKLNIDKNDNADISHGKRRYTACESPDCVRCQRYQIIRKEAKQKICQFQRIASGQVSHIASAIQTDPIFDKDLQQPNVLYVPNLKGVPWWNKQNFKESVDILESNYNVILDEFIHIYKADEVGDIGWNRNVTETGAWSTFYLYNQGTKILENCAKCPQTLSIVNSIPGFISNCVFGNVLFSVLMPGTEIAEHYGPTNIRIRCHLGLMIPEGCQLQVASKAHRWQKQCCLTFDDSFLHGVSYKPNIHHSFSAKERAVLIIDLWHPDLTKDEKDAIVYAFSSRYTSTSNR